MRKSIATLFFIVFFGFLSHSQEKPVRLVEEKQKKRTILYVQNDTDNEKSVFLKVNPIGYRRSAQRPIIKKIPAKSKIQILILIPLTNVKSYYTYSLVVNDKLDTIEVQRNKGLKKKDSIN